MSERRFPELTPETMTDEQRQVAEAIQSGPRGAGLRGPFNALMRHRLPSRDRQHNTTLGPDRRAGHGGGLA